MDETVGENLSPDGCYNNKCNILINCEKRRRMCGGSKEKRDGALLFSEEKTLVFL